ncbi:MAG: Gfo/Idh/MocA family oxidoreductase [Lentisphaerae bacterium]|jgi:virulence factor|nr:Gfo/Idh/MocA family oxidoreductase [Lentisphaerota bacterium]
MSEIKVAVVGAGGIANSVHLPSLVEIPEVKLVAICDLIPTKAQNLAKKFNIPKAYDHIEDMFANEDIDAVFCLVEPGSMFHVVSKSIEKGYYTFIEKPPGITSYQAESLARKADAAGKPMMVAFNRRYIPLVRETKKIVKEATQVTQVEGCFYKYGDAAFDKGSLSSFVSDTIHSIDLLRYLADADEAVKTALVTQRYDSPVDNAWNGVCLFDNDVTAIIKANYRVGGRTHHFQIHGVGMSAFIDLGMGSEMAMKTKILTHQGKISYSLAATGAANEKADELDGRVLANSDQFHKFYGYYFEDRHFIDCILNGTMPETSIQDAVKSIKLVETFLQHQL